MINKSNMTTLAGAAVLLAACASSNQTANNIQYPPTEQVTPIFQIGQAPESCRVFSHLFANMPAKMSTVDFAEKVMGEARANGADMLLLGQSRQCRDDSLPAYSYFGPAHEYRVTDWTGWSFGSEKWGEQGSWANIGYDEWTKNDVYYDYPVIMQAAFLRCRN